MLPFVGDATPLTQATTISQSGLTFSNFTYQLTTTGHASPRSAETIDVMGISKPDGIRFSSVFLALVTPADLRSNAGYVSYADATISFEVKSATGINQIGLDFDGQAFGTSAASVNELVFDSEHNLLGSLTVSCITGGACDHSDLLTLSGRYTDLYIVKDLSAASFGGAAWFSFVEQTFGTSATPEPGSFAMIGAGLIGVAGLLRRKMKAVKAESSN